MTPSRGDKIALVGHLQTKSRSPMRMSRLCAVLAVTVGAPLVYAEFAIGAALAENCCSPAGKDWPYTTGNLGGWGYTSLTQINKKNIEQLGPAWVTHVSAEPVTAPVPGPGNNATAQQTIPIVVDGVMYLDTPSGGVIALDGATGAVKWKWQPSVAANGFGGNNQHRGVSVGEGKVFTTAAGNRVVALDKDTGAIVWAVQPTAPGGATLGTIAKVLGRRSTSCEPWRRWAPLPRFARRTTTA